MNADGAIWSIVTIGGPILLGVVILWAILRNRKARGTDQGTEQATREVYRAEERLRDPWDDIVV